jgi:hypothetical protein
VEDAPDERIVVKDAAGERSVGVDVSYSGIWIVMAVASADVGIGLSVDAPGAQIALVEAAHIARQRAGRGEGAASSTWHGLVLPMPGELRGVVAVNRPVSEVHAFGWEKQIKANTDV